MEDDDKCVEQGAEQGGGRGTMDEEGESSIKHLSFLFEALEEPALIDVLGRTPALAQAVSRLLPFLTYGRTAAARLLAAKFAQVGCFTYNIVLVEEENLPTTGTCSAFTFILTTCYTISFTRCLTCLMQSVGRVSWCVCVCLCVFRLVSVSWMSERSEAREIHTLFSLGVGVCVLYFLFEQNTLRSYVCVFLLFLQCALLVCSGFFFLHPCKLTKNQRWCFGKTL